MKINLQGIVASLLLATLFTACSRPVAYFQPGTRDYVTRSIQPSAVPALQSSTPTVAVVSPTPSTVTPDSPQPVAQALQSMDKVEALVRNDQKLSADKTVQKRLNRIRTLLATQSRNVAVATPVSTAGKKMNLMERLVLKKMNRTISKQLAPANPHQPMAVKSILALGAVVLIAGILLLLLTTGTGATIGLIGVIAGLALLLIGLI